jgi:hypothetical protein
MGFPIKQRIIKSEYTKSGLDILTMAAEDYSNDMKDVDEQIPQPSSPSSSSTSDTIKSPKEIKKPTTSFPGMLREILSDEEHAHIISWSHSGKHFVIHDIHLFTNVILPKYFRQVIFRSFVRKLNRWGFKSLGISKAVAPSFGHIYFLRDAPELTARIRCSSNPAMKTPSRVTKDTQKEKIISSNETKAHGAVTDKLMLQSTKDVVLPGNNKILVGLSQQPQAAITPPAIAGALPLPPPLSSGLFHHPPSSQVLPGRLPQGSSTLAMTQYALKNFPQNNHLGTLSEAMFIENMERRRNDALLLRAHLMQTQAVDNMERQRNNDLLVRAHLMQTQADAIRARVAASEYGVYSANYEDLCAAAMRYM